ncbi:MAG: patatin-like phospholipase family protein [Roseomonas sp.]|nr:patatin-like phospholipase family protein [Roseomonas sp.]
MSDTQAKDPLAWLKDEWAALARRRFDGPDGAAARPIVGLALSGGGIRSASVSVGVLQALDRAGVLDRVDYLSTVSGGGYAGIGWLSRLAQEAPAASAAAARPAGRFPYGQGQAGLIWLRDRASYLLPPGAWEVAKVAAMVVRKLAGNVFRMLSAMMVMATVLALLSLGVTLLPRWASDPGALARDAALLLVVVVLVVGVVSCLIDTARAAKPPTPGLWQRLKTRLGGLFRRGQAGV